MMTTDYRPRHKYTVVMKSQDMEPVRVERETASVDSLFARDLSLVDVLPFLARSGGEWRVDKAVCVRNPYAPPMEGDHTASAEGEPVLLPTYTPDTGAIYLLLYSDKAMAWTQFEGYVYGLDPAELAQPLHIHWEENSPIFPKVDPFKDPEFGYTPASLLGTIYGLVDELARASGRYPLWWKPAETPASLEPKNEVDLFYNRGPKWSQWEFYAQEGRTAPHTLGLPPLQSYLTMTLLDLSPLDVLPTDHRAPVAERVRLLERIFQLWAKAPDVLSEEPDPQHGEARMMRIAGLTALYFYRARKAKLGG